MKVVLLTFDSVNFTMMTERSLSEKGYEFKTIPTPREISKSCGLSIMLKEDCLNDMISLKDELPIGYIWLYEKLNDSVYVEKVN